MRKIPQLFSLLTESMQRRAAEREGRRVGSAGIALSNEHKESNSDQAAQKGAAVKLNDEMKGRTGATLLGVDARESHDRWPYTISSALFDT